MHFNMLHGYTIKYTYSVIDMTPCQAYTDCVLSLDSLSRFGTKIITKQPGECSNTLKPWIYDVIFLGNQNTIHNI